MPQPEYFQRKNIFLFAVLKNLRIIQNCFFIERVVNGNCILPCELEITISLDLSPEKRIIKQYKTLKEDSYGTHLYQ